MTICTTTTRYTAMTRRATDVVSQKVRQGGEPEAIAQMRRGTSPRGTKPRQARHPNRQRTGAGAVAAAAVERGPREVVPIYDESPEGHCS